MTDVGVRERAVIEAARQFVVADRKWLTMTDAGALERATFALISAVAELDAQ